MMYVFQWTWLLFDTIMVIGNGSRYDVNFVVIGDTTGFHNHVMKLFYKGTIFTFSVSIHLE